jgi:hypothetical protein
MPIDASRDPRVQRIRDSINHPIVDVDAHQLEFVPVVLQYLAEEAGGALADRFIAFLKHLRRTFTMTEAQRADERVPMPVWWPMPTEKTVDRAWTRSASTSRSSTRASAWR